MAQDDPAQEDKPPRESLFARRSTATAIADSRARRKKLSHLLHAANPVDLCQYCARNAYYLSKLTAVFEIVNVAATVTGLGALIGHVEGNWTLLSLIPIILWCFTTAIGTALLDEHTTKPSTRFATANGFYALLLACIPASVLPLFTIYFQFGRAVVTAMSANGTEGLITLPWSVRQVVSCDPEELKDDAHAALLANLTESPDCTYADVAVVPTWQSLPAARWISYTVTAAGLTVATVAWCYGVHCYFARLRAVKQIFADGGSLDCIPYQYKPETNLLVNGHIAEPELELKLLEYFTDLDRRENEDLEDFLDATVHDLCENEESSLSAALCGRLRRPSLDP